MTSQVGFFRRSFDGHRAFWDGGITKGILASLIPWANTEKDARYLKPPVATGLWSRGGKVIHAPDDWLAKLPNRPLDGELYLGRGLFQEVSKTVKPLIPGLGWEKITYQAFDAPNYRQIFASGRINTPAWTADIDWMECNKFILGCKLFKMNPDDQKAYSFDDTYNQVLLKLDQNDVFKVLLQEKLPVYPKDAKARIDEKLLEVCEVGGEGLMLRHPGKPWEPKRSHYCLKVKKLEDAEAEIVGYIWGRETDKGSKLLGLMGALVCRMPNGKIFELSGFTDAERHMEPGYQAQLDEGTFDAGKPISDDWHNPEFPRGSQVTYKFRELTDDGLPKEARYWRKP